MGNMYLGIDPGKQGYITIMGEDGSINFRSIPLIGKEFDIHGLFDVMIGIAENYHIKHCVLESVHAIYGASAESTFSFGYGVGIIEGMLVSLSIPYTKIPPKTWQKEIWQGVPIQQKKSSTGKTMVNDTKLMSEMAAKRLFPNVDLRASERCKKSHDGKVDSLLIAEYCRRKFK